MRISDWSSEVCSSDLIPQEAAKSRDITGGLPRVADLFEARKPKEPAVLAETTGTIKFGPGTKGKQRVKIVRTDGSEAEILVPKWVEIRVFEGETVEQGEIMSDGEPRDRKSVVSGKSVAVRVDLGGPGSIKQK